MFDKSLNQNRDQSHKMGSYFPRTYITGLYSYLLRNPDRFQVITYNDLLWSSKDKCFGDFPAEFKAWNKMINADPVKSQKIHLMIQYDLDSRPDRAMDLLRDPCHRHVPVNIMLFNKRIDRKFLKATGQVKNTPYEIDDKLLSKFQDKGSVVGYHSNANERGGFSLEGAMTAFDEDVVALRKRFAIDYYTAHGGIPGPDGTNNNGLPFPQSWDGDIRWVHNGSSPRFEGVFSDGGHNNKTRDPKKRDMRDFIANLKPGRRYRMLLHPQYYDLRPKRSPTYSGTKWYDTLMDEHENCEAYDPWKHFE
jgi:hypothetical protein